MKDINEFINQIIEGDCLEVLKQLPDNSVNLVFTSPPYNTGNEGKNKDMYVEYIDAFSDEEYYKLLSGSLAEMLRICCGPVFLNLNYMENNKRVIYKLLYEFVDYLRENIIWDKGRCQPPIGNILGKRYEYVLLFTKNKDFVINAFKNNLAKGYERFFGNWISNLLQLSIKSDQTKYSGIHRAGFPLSLPKILIDIYTQEGDIVLDPFVGLGTAAIAAKELKRKYIGIEMQKRYCEIARNSLKQEILF